jgi:hypothetical protein
MSTYHYAFVIFERGIDTEIYKDIGVQVEIVRTWMILSCLYTPIMVQKSAGSYDTLVTILTNSVISHEWWKDWIVITINGTYPCYLWYRYSIAVNPLHNYTLKLHIGGVRLMQTCLTTELVRIVTRVSYVEQELLTLPEHLSSVPIFILFLLAIVLSVRLRLTPWVTNDDILYVIKICVLMLYSNHKTIS